MSETSNHGWNVPEVGGDTDIWGEILNDLFDEMDAQITLDGPFSERPDPGETELTYYHATDESVIYYNAGTEWTAISGVSDDTFTYVSGHTAWENGLSDEEIHRFSVGADESFHVSSLELREKDDGTSNADCTVNVFDQTNSTQIASVVLNERSDFDVETVEGSTVLFRLTNETGSTVDAAISIRGNIE